MNCVAVIQLPKHGPNTETLDGLEYHQINSMGRPCLDRIKLLDLCLSCPPSPLLIIIHDVTPTINRGTSPPMSDGSSTVFVAVLRH